MMNTTFAEPHYWCDQRCERCPLTISCSLARSEDESPIPAEDTCPLCRDLEALENIADFEIDLDAAIEDADRDVDDRADVFERYADAIVGLAGGFKRSRANRALLDELFELSVVVEVQSMPVAGIDSSNPMWRSHIVPSLFLLQRVDQLIAQSVGRLTAGSPVRRLEFEKVRHEFLNALAPLMEKIPLSAHAELERLRALNCAPSPFCITEKMQGRTVD